MSRHWFAEVSLTPISEIVSWILLREGTVRGSRCKSGDLSRSSAYPARRGNSTHGYAAVASNNNLNKAMASIQLSAEYECC